MLTVTVPGQKLFDEANNRFIKRPAVTLQLEHSLVSLARWESKWEKPFLNREKKTTEETHGYFEAMCLTPDVPHEVFTRIPNSEVKRIQEYIEAKNTATWFREMPNQPRNRQVITAEIIYNWMIALQIPLECEHWHLNRLTTLIKVVSDANQPKKKMSTREAMAQQRELNAQRRAASGSSG